MKKRLKIIRILVLLNGLILIVSASFLKITGNVISENTNIVGSILGLVFIAGGIALFLAQKEGGLETLVEEKPLPGKGIKGNYIPLSEILNEKHLKSNKVQVDVRGNKIYRNGREVQGLKLKDNYIEFKGVHFTNPGAAKVIQDYESLEIKNFEDPYVYLSESLNYSGKSEKSIRHMLGSSSAEEAVIVNVKYPANKIYLKFEKGRPTHYAIDGDIRRENLLTKKGHKVLRKKIKEL